VAAFVVLVAVAVLWLPDVVKTTGAILLIVPQQLGLVRQVMPSEVQGIDLSVPEQQVTLTQPGRYFVYYEFPFLADTTAYRWDSSPRVMMTPHGAGEPITMTPVKRGLQLYDTPFARGRPLYAFEVEEAGTYDLVYSSRPVTVSFVPDYTTGSEGVLAWSIGIQFGIMLAIVCGLLYHRQRRRHRLLAEMFGSRTKRAEVFREALRSDRATNGRQ
jgi:hypothetical protein